MERHDESERRRSMVERQLQARGIRDPQVLAALGRVPRHRFVRDTDVGDAYTDGPLPIGDDQTISQPYIVALMTECAGPLADARILEVGTGSGYQTAVLAECGATVYSVEIRPGLARQARARLDQLGYEQVQTRIGDGSDGWPEAAPFQAVLVTAAAPRAPEPHEPLLQQLAPGGRLVIPLGDADQNLVVMTREGPGIRTHTVCPVRFVRMTGWIRDPL